MSSLENKVSLSTLEKLTEVIEHKADKSDLVILSNEKANRISVEETNDKIAHIQAHSEAKLNEFRK